MHFSYCPRCGAPLQQKLQDDTQVPTCQNSKCGFVFWQNSKPCAGILIVKNNRLLLTVRKRDPEQGKLDLPGGFLHEDEHPYDGAKREIKEELGVEIAITGVLGFAIDRYEKDDGFTLNIGLLADITSGKLKPNDDVVALEWHEPSKVDRARLAFKNNEYFLNLWLQQQ